MNLINNKHIKMMAESICKLAVNIIAAAITTSHPTMFFVGVALYLAAIYVLNRLEPPYAD